ncbi:MAG: lipopolysaccharide heptosyltransferase II [Candidatus Omnitrophica bacterium]|nr:lipopolysaccharide heptosyltransferase II [Candidatus Omnitrophota bacterium]
MAHSPQRILLINPFGIGDVLFTTPLIRNLKQNFPDSFIGYLANTRTAPMLKAHPLIDRVMVYDRDDFVAVYRQSRIQFLQKWQGLLRTIKADRYDMVIDLSLNSGMNFLTALAGIQKRIGFNYKNRSWFLTKKISLKGYEARHVVEYYLDLLRPLGLQVELSPLELHIPDPEQKWARTYLVEQGIAEKERVIALVPGGGASWGKDALYKRWGAPKFAALADKIIANYGGKVILLGDSKEVALCEEVASLMQNSVILVCGKTSILQSAALLKNCKLAIVNDGGPLHMAVAVGIKTVSIFGPVDDRVYGPYDPFNVGNHRVATYPVACRPCYRNFRRAACDHISCLTRLSVDDVYKQVKEIFHG